MFLTLKSYVRVLWQEDPPYINTSKMICNSLGSLAMEYVTMGDIKYGGWSETMQATEEI